MNLALRDDVAALATLARCLCGNSADADDLVQDTLERA
jgi:DNA-directed RNA polymerase specialized sigma24 family protein